MKENWPTLLTIFCIVFPLAVTLHLMTRRLVERFDKQMAARNEQFDKMMAERIEQVSKRWAA